MRITSAIYHGLVMARHPEAIGLRLKGINFENYRDLHRPWLLALGIGTILDVGANVGQFARLAHAVWPSAAIHSFEPLPDCFRELQSALPAGADFHPSNIGLGAEEGELELQRCSHSPSSSFLAMTPLHRDAFPESAADGDSRVKVAVRRLDDVAAGIAVRNNLLIKLDVQGYELEVLRGGHATFGQACAAVIETSFLPLYENQPLFGEVFDAMRALDFEYRGNLTQMLHPEDQRIVQADSVFVRRSP